MSACMARRFRSRQVIWITGSRPISRISFPAAMLETRTMAVWLSVRFTASTQPLSSAAFLRITSRSALFGGPSSAVTANPPDASTFSRRLPDL